MIRIKEKIKLLSNYAVAKIEKNFHSQEGELKKLAAVTFVSNALPIYPIFKPFAKIIFAKLIDVSVEKAIQSIKELEKNIQS